MSPTPDQLRSILESGIQAPSAENKHHLRFLLLGDKVWLLATDIASWNVQPHRKLLAFISFGAVTENMALRAASFGFAQTVHWLPNPDHPELIAEFHWRPTQEAPDPLVEAVPARHTNRRFYRRTPLSASTLARLSAAAEAVANVKVIWLNEPSQRALALRAIRIAETERFRRRALHEELFSAIRFESGWRETTNEWLPPGALEVERAMRPPFALLKNWTVMKALTMVGMHLGLGLRAGYLPCALSPKLGLIIATGAHEDGLQSLTVGRALERVWLAATSEGLGFQPMAAAVALLHQRPGNGWVSPNIQRQLQYLMSRITADPHATPYLFFRIGHASRPTVIAKRIAVEEFVFGKTAP